MDTFSWLVVAHLIGDWLLQNHWMANGKHRAFFTTAGLTHFTIYTLTIITVLWLEPTTDLTLVSVVRVGLFVFISHWIIDATGLAIYWVRFYRQSDLVMMRVMVDQVFHVLALVVVASFLI
ncbi:MAG: DUF3307 domain-containing protein [Anaerolineae bacterium]|nr:DUF3307 domain-containing protein [Anaerolineae bacterium]